MSRNLTLEEIFEIEDQPIKEIHEYAKSALNELELKGRTGDIGERGVYPNLDGYWIRFYVENNPPCNVTLNAIPPEADSRWYIQEIKRQLQEKLALHR